MAEICCGLVSDVEVSTPGESNSRAARRRRMEIRRFKFVSGVAPSPPETMTERGQKRRKEKDRDYENAVENWLLLEEDSQFSGKSESTTRTTTDQISISGEPPKFGFTSVCGRRRDMEDALAIFPSFCRRYNETTSELHYFGVYDGHGCSHVR